MKPKRSVEDFLYSPTPVERNVEQAFGMKPGLNRGSILPFHTDAQGDNHWAAPQFVYDAAKALVTPGTAAQTGQLSVDDYMNFLFGVGAGGLAAPRPKGPVVTSGGGQPPRFGVIQGGASAPKTKTPAKPLQRQAEVLGKNPNSISDLRETEKLQNFSANLRQQVQERAQAMARTGREAHEAGKLPFTVGTRFTTSHSRENNLRPWIVESHFVDPKRPGRIGYRAYRGDPKTKDLDESDYETALILVEDPDRPHLRELSNQFIPLQGPRK